MEPIGEVLSSSITSIVAESWTRDDHSGPIKQHRPRFGSFVRVECADELQVFALVHNVITEPVDNVHKPLALRLSREQLAVEQPHIFALLHTEIHAICIAHKRGKTLFNHLPPVPPEVHDFVFPASKEEIIESSENLDFLRSLANLSGAPTDELVAASVREASQARNNDYAFLVAAGQALTHLFKDDYDRLLAVLRKIKPH